MQGRGSIIFTAATCTFPIVGHWWKGLKNLGIFKPFSEPSPSRLKWMCGQPRGLYIFSVEMATMVIGLLLSLLSRGTKVFSKKYLTLVLKPQLKL